MNFFEYFLGFIGLIGVFVICREIKDGRDDRERYERERREAELKVRALAPKGWVAKYKIPLIECPKCHIAFIPPVELWVSMLNYCPNCGRKMDGGETE